MSRKSEKEKSKFFTEGYKEVRRMMNEYYRGLMCCETCNFFYQGKKDDYEVCHNHFVTQFDMIDIPFGTVCALWKPVDGKNEMSLQNMKDKISSELETNLRIISRNFTSAQKSRMNRKR